MKEGEGDFLSSEEVLARLDVKPATLYAYVSRGLVRRVRNPKTGRSVYARADIERLGARRRGAPSRISAAATSMRWGDPIISTSITCIGEQGPIYRHRPAPELARSGALFEATVHLLLTGIWQPDTAPWPAIQTPPDVRAQLRRTSTLTSSSDVGKVLAGAVLALGMGGRGAEELGGAGTALSARLILQTMAGSLGLLGPSRSFLERRAGESLSQLVLRATGIARTPERLAVVDSVLIMLADHELAAATFAARVAASTDSDLFNCVAAAICAHSGFSAGAATDHIDEKLYKPLAPGKVAALLTLLRERGATTFGFNHPLYPAGDPRADYILELVATLQPADAKVRRFLAFIDEARVEARAHPGIAAALTALVHALGMPPYSAAALWILSRTAGWMAHALEQRTQAFMLRPRAKYTSSMSMGTAGPRRPDVPRGTHISPEEPSS